MKVLVATHETQGQRKNDCCFCEDGELVGFNFECDRETVDGPCGCRRSLVGFKCMQITTTFLVADLPDTTVERMRTELRESKQAGGWLSGMQEDKIAEWVNGEVGELARIAIMFPAGTILEKRGRSIHRRVPKPPKKVRAPRIKSVPMARQPHDSDLRFA